MLTRHARPAAILLLLFAAACGDPDDLQNEPVEAAGETAGIEASAVSFAAPNAGIAAFAVEDFNGTEIAHARSLLPLLASKGIAVGLHWKASDLDNQERWDFVMQARSLGVEVRPWLLLDEADGYWPGSTNASIFASKARQLISLWTNTYGLPPTTFVVDMEMRVDRFRRLNEMLAEPVPNVIAIAAFMASGINRWQYFWATQTYAALVNELRWKGWKVHCTTLPQIADDYSDGDDGIRQAMGIPIDGINWNSISIQTYRSIFAQQTGGLPLTPFFVYDYGKMAKRNWGSKAGLDIGLTWAGIDGGSAALASTYASADELKRDVEAALAAGFRADQIFVYNLEGLYQRPPAAEWVQTPRANPPAPPLDLGTPFLHTLSIGLDFLL